MKPVKGGRMQFDDAAGPGRVDAALKVFECLHFPSLASAGEGKGGGIDSAGSTVESFRINGGIRPDTDNNRHCVDSSVRSAQASPPFRGMPRRTHGAEPQPQQERCCGRKVSDSEQLEKQG